MELPGKRPKMRFMDAVREDMTAVEVTKKNAEERTEWRRRIRCGDPQWEQPKEEEEDLDTWHATGTVWKRACGAPIYTDIIDVTLDTN